MADLAPELLHAHLLERAPRILRFDPEDYFPEWQSAVRRSFRQLIGLMPARVPAEVAVVSEMVVPGPCAHRAVRFVFTAEPRVRVPCALLMPEGGEMTGGEPFPVVLWVCDGTEGEDDFAVRALGRGYAVLRMAMRGCGERAGAGGEDHASAVALLLGRTMIGERVWDVVRAMDVLTEHFPRMDAARVHVCGCGVAGAVAFYAAAFDPRIAAVTAAGGVAAYASSIGEIPQGIALYLPNILHYFDIADLAGLIVPRPLTVVSDPEDRLFPLAGVRECFAEMRAIYDAQNCGEACRLLAAQQDRVMEQMATTLAQR